MSDLSELVAARIRDLGLDQPQPPTPSEEWGWHPVHAAVEPSKDLERILALPRRPAAPPSDVAALMTARLRRPGSTMELRPLQAWGLAEAEDNAGLVGMISVGGGKTGLSLLLPTVFGSQRAVLLIPPQLKAQLLERDYALWANNFYVHNLHPTQSKVFHPDMASRGWVYVATYSELSSAKGADVLERMRPDTLILDEAHKVRDGSAARTKRFRRFIRGAIGSGALKHVVLLSGTLGTKTVHDYDMIKYALRERTPVPLHYPTLDEWSAALDPGPVRAAPGELVRLCEPGEDPRHGFRRRLVETPGVIASGESELGVGLEIHERPTKCPPAVEKALRAFRESWEMDGAEILDALTFSRYARQLAAGLYLRWTWPRGESEALRTEWIETRREYHRWVRAFLADRAAPNLDSPGRLEVALREGRLSCAEWEPWEKIRDQAKPETEAVWIDKWLVDECVKWAHEEPGIVWYTHEAFGREVAERGGLPFYGGGDEASAEIIHEKGDRSIVASIHAHQEGKNLQFAFGRMLYSTPSSSAKTWEQSLGRCHRELQPRDTVYAYVFQHTLEMRQAFANARREAEFAHETTGADQKLLLATITFPVSP